MDRALDVSVVISTHNRAASVPGALDALANQAVPQGLEYEVIVVDNNSSDSTREVVNGYAERGFARLRYVFEARQGVSQGRNAGIAAARGEIVAFTDDDNEVAADWIVTLKAVLDARPDIVAVGGPVLPRWPDLPPRWLDRRHWSPLAILDYGPASFESSAGNPVCLLTANLAVRRQVFSRIGAFSAAFPRCQDHEFQIRLWRAGMRVLYSPSLVVYARVQAERLTHRYHRRWHRRHGEFAAAMRLQEIIGPTGALLETPAPATTLFGVPSYVYRELLAEAKRWLAAVLTGRRSLAFHHANRMRYLVGYLRRRASDRSPLALLSELAPLRPRRLALVYALMVVLVGGSLYDIAKHTEHWPLSSYPMFSQMDLKPEAEAIWLFGVTQGKQPAEIALLDPALIHPFDQCRLSTALARTYYNQSRRPLTDALLRDVLERYESRRIRQEHDGPPLAAVRAYLQRWHLDPAARNVNTPEHRELIAEVTLAHGEAQR